MSRARGNPRMTRKHMARAQRDCIMSRWITGAAVAVGIAVFGLIAFAFFGVDFVESRQSIATVNGEELSVRAFKARVRLIQLSMINEYQYAQSILQIYAEEPNISAIYQQRLQQLSSELDNPGLHGQRALDGLIKDTLVRQEANARGIFVTQEDIMRTVAEKDFNFYPDGTPTPQLSLTPNPAAQVTAAPSATASEGSGTPSSSPTPRPTATAYTEEAYQINYAEQMASFKDLGILEEDYLDVIESELYQEKLMANLEQELARDEDQVWLRHIMVEDADEARSVIARIADGEAWEDLAAELSLDILTKDDGGDLGWLTNQDINIEYGDAFTIVAFASDVDEVAGPLQTDSGWHVIQIMGHEVRPLSDAAFEQLLQSEYDDLIEESMAQGDIELKENWTDYIPFASELVSQVMPE